MKEFFIGFDEVDPSIWEHNTPKPPKCISNDRYVGRCSICGGRVTIPTLWWSTQPPVATCESCGAVRESDYGPVVPMIPKPPYRPRRHPQFPYTDSEPYYKD